MSITVRKSNAELNEPNNRLIIVNKSFIVITLIHDIVMLDKSPTLQKKRTFRLATI
ncbi:Uncharacterised protein [Scardovia inopinata]|uniref:Uncharacterized protein n=1 Tax=Scardovia inopinata F0304 TaxID=641146 RepID=W1MXB0_SCAIO|nr:hypothetical protein [Scardovia inopinata]EQW16358.1 hypothetical protein HMPREF9020_01534 [Scardovia inopinata F0304]BAR06977.1 hypothetical protein SCIP_0910 [Scardovia inopinata JCM 12537]SUV51043.1 Uncharacterised protein [Scardovia inopinata]